MKKYKPKRWFAYARFLFIFFTLLFVSKNTELFNKTYSVSDMNKSKAVELAIIEENKENIYTTENYALNRYLSLPEKGFQVSDTNRKYVVEGYDYNLLVAVVASESTKKQDDVLAVMSVILNRCDGSGLSPVSVITRPGQFSGYLDGYYRRYLDESGNLIYYSFMPMIKEVVNDALNGIRNTTYSSFRSWSTTSYSDNYIVEYGNRYK